MKKEKIQQLETRVAQLEKEVRELKQTKRTNEKGSASEQIVDKQKPTEKEPILKQPEVPPQGTKQNEAIDWETQLGKVWLPRIFIFVLLLGLVWGFRIAVDAGWLNEINRIILGFIIAGVFYFVGDRQLKKNRNALGKVLLVGFVTVLMVTTFAMNVLYGMVPSGIAFFLNIVWVGIGIYLSHRHHSQAMGIMFAVTGYLIPFLVAGSGNFATINMVITYELTYYIALLWFAVRNQYRILFYTSTIFLHLVYFALLIGSIVVFESFHVFLMALAILIQHEVLFYILLKKKIEKLRAFPILFSSFTITLLWAKIGFEMYNVPTLFTIYVLATVIRYGWTSYNAKRKEKKDIFSLSTVLATMGIAVFIADVVENHYIASSLYLIQGVLAVYIGYTYQSTIQRYIGYIIYYGMMLFMLTDMHFYEWEKIVLWGILIGTLYLQVLFSQRAKDEESTPFHIVLALLAHVLFLVGLDYHRFSFGPLFWISIIGSLYAFYRLAKEQMSTGIKRGYLGVNVMIHLAFIAYLAGEFIIDSNTVVLVTTAGWSLYALGCVYLGMKREHRELRMLGIGLIFITLLKLIFFDLAFVSLVTRSILFVFIGLIGIIVSRFIYGKHK